MTDPLISPADVYLIDERSAARLLGVSAATLARLREALIRELRPWVILFRESWIEARENAERREP